MQVFPTSLLLQVHRTITKEIVFVFNPDQRASQGGNVPTCTIQVPLPIILGRIPINIMLYVPCLEGVEEGSEFTHVLSPGHSIAENNEVVFCQLVVVLRGLRRDLNTHSHNVDGVQGKNQACGVAPFKPIPVQKFLHNRRPTPFVLTLSEGYFAVLGRRQQHDVPYRPNEYDPAKSPIRQEPMEIVFQQSQYILFWQFDDETAQLNLP